jgi:hypothetical protein
LYDDATSSSPRGRGGVVLGGDDAVEGEAGGADAHDEGEALGAVLGVGEE